MSDNDKCFLSGKTDCELTEIPIDGITYFIGDELADEFSLKKLKAKIEEKIAENLAKEEKEEKLAKVKKDKAMAELASAVDALGISQEDLGRLLLKKAGVDVEAPAAPAAATATATAVATATATKAPPTEDGFVDVDGTLKSKTMSLNAEEGVGGAIPAYSKVNDTEGKSVIESQKRVKRLNDGGIIERSNMGTTVIRINPQDPGLDKMLKQTDENKELVRAAVSGSGTMSGGQTVDCPLCSGSGITKIGHNTCPKCGGAGMIQV